MEETKQPTEEKEKPPVQLGPGFERMCLFETANTRWNVSVPIKVTREHLLVPAFWAHHANGKRPGDEIRALADDGTWRAEYLVLDSAKTWLKVKELNFIELSVQEKAETEMQVKAVEGEYEVVFRGPRKWSVLRKHDGAVMQQDIQEKDVAHQWLYKFVRAEAADRAAA